MNSTEEIDSINLLLPQLRYDDVTGCNYRLKSGKRAGCRRGAYRTIGIGEIEIFEHRLNWYREHGHLPEHLSFICKDTYSNHPSNLRPATRSQINARSRKTKTATSSKYKGASYQESASLWAAHIRINGKKIHLGLFDSEEEARGRYEETHRAYYSDFSPNTLRN